MGTLTEISKAKNPLWDGDGVQGVGQPRGAQGKWVKTRAGSTLRAAIRAAEEIDESVERSSRRSTKGSTASPRGTEKNWDHRAKSIAPSLKIKKPQKGSSHVSMVGGKEIPRKTKYTPEEAYYHRNNGAKKISNERLAEIFMDRSKMTHDERDLVSSASSDTRFDGEAPEVSYKAKGGGRGERESSRAILFKNLKTAIAQDHARSSSKERGAGGQVLLHNLNDERAKKQRVKDNEKRLNNNRNKVNAAFRKKIMEDFGNGQTALCIFCGKPVDLKQFSPERIKPGLIGGDYSMGNVGPAHVSCNKKASADVGDTQYNPDDYYRKMTQNFLKFYKTEINEGKLNHVFNKHRKLLGPHRPKGKK